MIDLCCGTGRLANKFLSGGWLSVICIDLSTDQLAFARCVAPDATFSCQDARSFSWHEQANLVVSMCDSLAHMCSTDDLLAVFKSVCRALKPGGLFIFDLNDDQGFSERRNGPFNIARSDHVATGMSVYNYETRRTNLNVTLCSLADERWIRADFAFEQTYYERPLVEKLLRDAGLSLVDCFDTKLDLKFDFELGRRMYVATR
ncbi:class I SAM-dependent methyltransferase [Bradyrhizobium barranii subsp. apii]|uniref:Class I SAM-dependent methyltransferase n=1 Tax=Bradyrhizobium barranii subsp. apii TaxID=2819348 RepID=A0A8U0FR00_9BRAD|nr:class I SAM-dependent methyltransferase [Bradyrhizobium barranii]UPT89240.1 class I SAM-dependent methyltransferase [Bradyrhizobium barranii subsp. apii]